EIATNTVVATVPVGARPIAVAITPDGTHAFVTNQNSNTVSVIETATNTVVATVPVGAAPFAVAITPAPSVEELITALFAQVQAMNLNTGLTDALISKLQAALTTFQVGDTQATLNLLQAFINQCMAQSGKQLTTAQADALIAAAQAIMAAIPA